jgi:hypothetical protein
MQLTLGDVIDALERCERNSWVRYDFGNLVPDGLRSYRGYYEQLALGWREIGGKKAIIVSDLLQECKQAVGLIFTGYKGGRYRMTRDTEIWVANYGHSTDTIITAIRQVDTYEDGGGIVVIETGYMP